ncbi:hypothetical protein G6F36_015218 [Rhizopus arrhizus]|nr:hypothetical protein G6F36_015218 [Rhizopus arrhizus]
MIVVQKNPEQNEEQMAVKVEGSKSELDNDIEVSQPRHTAITILTPEGIPHKNTQLDADNSASNSRINPKSN